jgi:hypothetical protein
VKGSALGFKPDFARFNDPDFHVKQECSPGSSMNMAVQANKVAREANKRARRLVLSRLAR